MDWGWKPNLAGASEVGFARMILINGNMWFLKRMDKRVGDKEPLITGCLRSHP